MNRQDLPAGMQFKTVQAAMKKIHLGLKHANCLPDKDLEIAEDRSKTRSVLRGSSTGLLEASLKFTHPFIEH